MSLDRATADAVLATLRAEAQSTLANAEKNQRDGESGISHGLLSVFGADHDSQLDEQVGAVKIVISSIDRLAGDEDSAVNDRDWGDRWLDAARAAENALKEMSVYQADATIDDTLKRTATATEQQVNQAVSAAAGFVWRAIPWWAWGGLALTIGGLIWLRVGRRAAA
jgi:hypothetical protein